MFCGNMDHLVREFPITTQYIQQQKIIHNDYGKLMLPDSTYVPQSLPRRNMCEHVDNFWIARKGPQPDALTTHFLEGPEECIFTVDIKTPSTANSSSPLYPASSAGPSTYDDAVFQAELIQAQINSLREAQVLTLEREKKLQFDGIKIMKRTGPPKPGSPIPAPPSPPKPNVFARGPTPTHDVALIPNQQSNHSPNVIGKPRAQAGNNQLQRPQGPMRPITIPPKHTAEDPKYHYLCPLKSSVKPTDLADCQGHSAPLLLVPDVTILS